MRAIRPTCYPASSCLLVVRRVAGRSDSPHWLHHAANTRRTGRAATGTIAPPLLLENAQEFTSWAFSFFGDRSAVLPTVCLSVPNAWAIPANSCEVVTVT